MSEGDSVIEGQHFCLWTVSLPNEKIRVVAASAEDALRAVKAWMDDPPHLAARREWGEVKWVEFPDNSMYSIIVSKRLDPKNRMY